MKKTYWWRMSVIFLGVLFLVVAYVMNSFKLYEEINSPLFIFSLAILVVSAPLFFITDKIFLKWLRFAVIWILLSIFLIAITPERHAFFVMDPDRELVSIWMGSLFVILSLIQIIWQSIKVKKK